MLKTLDYCKYDYDHDVVVRDRTGYSEHDILFQNQFEYSQFCLTSALLPALIWARAEIFDCILPQHETRQQFKTPDCRVWKVGSSSWNLSKTELSGNQPTLPQPDRASIKWPQSMSATQRSRYKSIRQRSAYLVRIANFILQKWTELSGSAGWTS